MTQSVLAEALGCSTAYANGVVRGTKRVSARWADLVADTLELSEAERVRLHRAAAADHGFRLDLTKP